jgi:uncharacterized protein (DUF58 family)
MKITAPFLVILITAIFLFLAATNIQGGWLYVLDALLWSAIVLAFGVPFLQLRRLALSRHLPDAPVAGVPQKIELQLTNLSRWPVMFLNLEELPVFSLRTGQSLLLSEEKHFSVWTQAGESTSFSTQFTPEKAGVYVFKGLQVGSFGPLGLLGVYWKQSLPAAWVVCPLPPEKGLALLPEGLMQNLQQARRRSHFSEDISHFRQYQPGDSRRSIHWKNTARQGHLIVAEAREEPFQRAVVIFDTQASSHSEQPLDALVRTAEWVCQGLLERQIEVACWAQAADPNYWAPYCFPAPARQLAGARDWDSLSYWLATLALDAPLALGQALLQQGPAIENSLIVLICAEMPTQVCLSHLLQAQGANGGLPLLIYTLERDPALSQELSTQISVHTIESVDSSQ